MKSVSMLSKTFFITISAIILIAGALTLGLPVICNASGPGPGPGGPCSGANFCGKSGSVGASNSYVQIPILNNHHPATATITKVHVEVPADLCSEEEYDMGHHCRCNASTETRLKEIKFGDTVAYSESTSYCVCPNPDHEDGSGHLFVLDSEDYYSFSDAKVVCRLTLDVATAPSGLYSVTYYYTLPGDATVRSNELTFTIP